MMRVVGGPITEERGMRTRGARAGLTAALLAVVAACWIAPVWAQEHGGAGHSAPAVNAPLGGAGTPHAPAANSPHGSSASSPAERGSHQGTHEPAPGGLGAPQTGTHE